MLRCSRFSTDDGSEEAGEGMEREGKGRGCMMRVQYGVGSRDMS
jgi:hypothetical protein